MKLPLYASVSSDHASKIAKKMTKVVLSQIIDKVTVTERYVTTHDTISNVKKIKVRVWMWPTDMYATEFGISWEDVVKCFEMRFISNLESYVVRELKNRVRKDVADTDQIGVGATFDEETGKRDNEDGEEKPEKSKAKHDSDDEDDVGSDAEGDGDATEEKANRNKMQSATYDEPDEDDEKIIDEINKKENDGDDHDHDGIDEKDVNGMTLADRIVHSSKFVSQFKMDKKNERWCEIEMDFPSETKKLLMISIIEHVSKKCVIKEVHGLSRTYLMASESENDKIVCFLVFLDYIKYLVESWNRGC